VHVGRGLHVAADPGAEAHDYRQVDGLGRDAIELAERRGDLLVERGNDRIEDFDQIKNRMLTLVGDREAFAWMLLGLPIGADFGANALEQCALLVGGCASSTGSIESCASSASTSCRLSPEDLSSESASTTPPGCGRSLSC